MSTLDELREVRAASSRRLRANRAAAGLKEIRNLYIPPEHEELIRAFARTLEKDDET